MAKTDEDKIRLMIKQIQAMPGWKVDEEGHAKKFWKITSPTTETVHYPIPIKVTNKQIPAFRVRITKLGTPWEAFEDNWAQLEKAKAEETAKSQRRAERVRAEQIKAAQAEKAAALAAADEASKARWNAPRRVCVTTQRITPEWALELVADNHGPLGWDTEDLIPVNADLVSAYRKAIAAGNVDIPLPVVLDWSERVLFGMELLTAIVEEGVPVTCDITRDVDPATYELINLVLTFHEHTQAPQVIRQAPAAAPVEPDEEGDNFLDAAPAAQTAVEPVAATPEPESAPELTPREEAIYRLLYAYDNVPAPLWNKEKLTAEKILEAADTYGDLTSAVHYGMKMVAATNQGQAHWSPTPAFGFCYLALDAWQVDEAPQMLDDYIRGVMRGYDLKPGDPRMAVRDWMWRQHNRAQKEAAARGAGMRRTNAAEQLMVLIKGWNAFCAGRKVKVGQIGWSEDEGSIPLFPAEAPPVL